MEENNYCMLGTKTDNGDGTTTYTNDYSEEGCVFKDMKAYETGEGVCYIAECVFSSKNSEPIDAYFDKFKMVVRNEDIPKLIESGGVSTRQSIMEDIMERARRDFNEGYIHCPTDKFEDRLKEFAEYIGAFAMDCNTWCCMSTFLDGLDIAEEWEVWWEDCGETDK